MTTRIFNAERWIVHSPSLYEHASLPVCVGYDGTMWRVMVNGKWGDRSFDTRDMAMALCAAPERFAREEAFPDWGA